MGQQLFTNVNIIDGSGKKPFLGQVLVEGNRIKKVTKGAGENPTAEGACVIDGGGTHLMPGLCDAHTHLSWNGAATLQEIQFMPPEEHTLYAANAARTVLDMGYTMCVGAAAAKPRLDVVIRNAINNGDIPGPRYLANSQEIATLGGLGDTAPPHIDHPALNFGALVNGPEEMRAMVRSFLKHGVDLIKLNLSGEEICGIPGGETVMSEEECAMAVVEAHRRGVGVCAHARSAESVKMCVRHGITHIFHASYADDEAIDMVAANRDKHFVTPGLAWLVRTARNAEAYGIATDSALAIQYGRELEIACAGLKKMLERGIRVLPGGDYGFAWTPHGTNARDLQYFVELLGMSPMDAIVSATSLGGAAMGRPDELGQIKAGFLADLIIVDGNPLTDISILQDRDRILAVMKDGDFFRAPNQWPAAARQNRAA